MVLYSFIIPSFNEAQSLPKLCEKLIKILKKTNKLEIILVNNGSTDQTINVLKKQKINKYKNFKILNIKKNIGYGHGILSGLYISRGQILTWFHADLQADPNEIFKALTKNKKKILNENYILKGNRNIRKFFFNFFTYFMSVFVTLCLKLQLMISMLNPRCLIKNP